MGGIGISPEPVVAEVQAGSPAALAGFQPGDRIVKIVRADGAELVPESYLDMQTFTASDENERTYYVDRDGLEVTITVTPAFDEEEQRYLVGIVGPERTVKEVTWGNCWYYGWYEMRQIVRMMLSVITGLFFGRGLDQLSGPVGIYQATETYAAMGFASFMFLIGQLSLNVGIFNLLPLPAIDGGKLKKTKVDVTGVLVEGVGYGAATIKKVGGVPVTVE